MSTYGIDKRVWDEVNSKRPPPTMPAEVVLAACHCAALLPDKERGEAGYVRREIFGRLAEAEQSEEAIECHGGSASAVIRNALVEWVMASKNAKRALNRLAWWDSGLSVWCACAVAEDALKNGPAGEAARKSIGDQNEQLVNTFYENPLTAIRTARDWVLGGATFTPTGRSVLNRVKKIEWSVINSRNIVYGQLEFNPFNNAAFDACSSACYAAYSIASLESRGTVGFVASIEAAVDYAVRSKTKNSINQIAADDPEYKRLCEVVAQGIVSYPTGEMVGGSGMALGREGLASRVPWRVV